MTTLHRLTFLALTLLLVSGCGNVPENSLSFDDVVYVEKQLPPTLTLSDADTLKIPVLGVMNFAVADSLLLVSNDDNSAQVTVLSLDGTTVMGRFLRTGRGPGETTQFPGIGNVALSTGEDGHLLATWNSHAGIVMTLDISASLESGQTILDDRDLALENSSWILGLIPVDDNRLLIAKSEMEDLNTIMRFVLSADGSTRVTPPLERLNRVTVKERTGSGGEQVSSSGNQVVFASPNINYINGSYAYNQERGIIIEAERVRNTINIFTLDGEYTKTICTYGDRPDDISALKTGRDDGKKERLTLHPKAYPDFFAVLHWNRAENGKHIWLFNYDGQPIADIPVPQTTTRYDIDPAGKRLYLLEPGNELLLRYDISL